MSLAPKNGFDQKQVICGTNHVRMDKQDELSIFQHLRYQSKSFNNDEPRLTRSARLGPPTPPSLLNP